MSFSPYWIYGTGSNPMTLSVFLAVTLLIVETVGDGFTAMDNVIIVLTSQMTLLDYFLVTVVMEELWDFWDYLRSNE